MNARTTGFNPEYHRDPPAIEALRAEPGKVLLEFGAPWCGHCLAARDAVQALMASHPALAHIKVYDGKGQPLGRAFGVKLWPTLIVLDNGQEVARAVRPRSEGELSGLASALAS